MRKRIYTVVLGALFLVTGTMLPAQAARKPFHCHYDYEGRGIYSLFMPSWVLHCDRIWR